MDLLSQRYASPFLLLDEFIKIEQLQDFVVETLTTIFEEKKEEIRWEYFLHKIDDMSYQQYLDYLESKDTESNEMQEEEVKNVVEESFALLDLF